ncbi:arrd-17 [Pristionchus pacificus]|nr:arrd-17 [Pristionchus pacificus]|eukprot:PDM77600.1 arrd-17 [Pristionchus pacificus]
MKLEKFHIELDNSENAYFAGQEVSGKIIIDAPEPKKINEILLELKGRCRTAWTKHSGKSRKHCNNSEPYFLEQLNTLYTHKFTQEDGKDRILPCGHHEIPFSYTLPKSLPSSFEGDHGFVRYTCRAIAERPWDFDIVSRTAFTVVGIEDINSDPTLCEPTSATESNQTVAALCWKASGSVQAELSVAKSGYTPGEMIEAVAKASTRFVQNNSSKTRKVCLKLTQHAVYKAKTFAGHEQSKVTKKQIMRKELGEAATHAQLDAAVERMQIPSLPPRLGRCKSIHISYTIDLEVESTLTTSIPITLGTIPLLADLLTHSKQSVVKNGSNVGPLHKISMPGEDTVVQVTITDEDGLTHTEDDSISNELDAFLSARKRVRMPSSILSELYPTMPSPYYRESFFGKVDISDEKESIQFGDNEFAPKYPFYTD